MARSHSESHFYKYMPCDTAESVLNSCSLRWREPKQFNDPFDHQMNFIFPYTEDELFAALSKRLEDLIFGEEPTFREQTTLAILVGQLRRITDKVPKSEIFSSVEQGLEESKGNFQQYIESMNSLITVELNKSRVLCVSEKNDNVVMWSHYADSHKGICLRLQCDDGLDNTLLIARPVSYSRSFPVLPTVNDHVDYLTGISQRDYSEIVYDVPYTKHEDWSYESEWRVHVPHEDHSNQVGFDDWQEDPCIFGALYLGCRIGSDEREKLIGIVKSKYPHMEVYRSMISNIGFDLEFDRVF